ncbi:MAG: glutamate racemase [Prevotellaceae bacterium]|jgi:glutamate racemase|nr:glutamate racemase [Prevotellaceae bacterium]
MSSAPVGLLDSGIGGLSVWREVTRLLPHEHTVYYADSAYCPYGPKTREEIIARVVHITNFLLTKQAKLIVVACNTATAAAIDYLREQYNKTLFVGMEPAVKPAALLSKSGVVGVLATQGTFNGRLYHETVERFAANTTVIEQYGDGLVELIEAGKIDTPEMDALLHKYINPMLEAGADHIALGCTHYSFLIPAIRKITENKAELLDPAPAVAQQVKHLLVQNNLIDTETTKPKYEFFSDEKPFQFNEQLTMNNE